MTFKNTRAAILDETKSLSSLGLCSFFQWLTSGQGETYKEHLHINAALLLMVTNIWCREASHRY